MFFPFSLKRNLFENLFVLKAYYQFDPDSSNSLEHGNQTIIGWEPDGSFPHKKFRKSIKG